MARAGAVESLIAAGDILRVAVFQSADLTKEVRVDANGTMSFPLIGTVPVAGLSTGQAEQLIAKMLRDGGFLVAPQVSVSTVQARGSQVTVLGAVGRPGRFPIDSTDNKLSDVIALAGGLGVNAADYVVLTGTRDGAPFRREIDVLNLATSAGSAGDVRLQAGDMLYVNRAPTFFIYGEVQRGGSFRLERGMSVMQALATAGGLTPKGTQRGMMIHRRRPDGTVQIIEPKIDDPILADDVLYIKESLF
jgi:polysaccharide export outer membrane protein